jgi:hypothetical protein
MSNEFMERKEDEMVQDVLSMSVSDFLVELKDSDLGPILDDMVDQLVQDRLDFMVYQENG